MGFISILFISWQKHYVYAVIKSYSKYANETHA